MINKISAIQSVHSQNKSQASKSNVSFGEAIHEIPNFLNPKWKLRTRLNDLDESRSLVDLMAKIKDGSVKYLKNLKDVYVLGNHGISISVSKLSNDIKVEAVKTNSVLKLSDRDLSSFVKETYKNVRDELIDIVNREQYLI